MRCIQSFLVSYYQLSTSLISLCSKAVSYGYGEKQQKKKHQLPQPDALKLHGIMTNRHGDIHYVAVNLVHDPNAIPMQMR